MLDYYGENNVTVKPLVSRGGNLARPAPSSARIWRSEFDMIIKWVGLGFMILDLIECA